MLVMWKVFRNFAIGMEIGTVTAELAMALPSVVLIVSICVAGFGLQVERLKLVTLAASAARALGRGETESSIAAILKTADERAVLRVEVLEDLICANLKRYFEVVGLKSLEISERQCARKAGL